MVQNIISLSSCLSSDVNVSETNACDSGEADCSHLCESVEGITHCLCPIGLELDRDGKTCIGKL